jgi:hypothetical protein
LPSLNIYNPKMENEKKIQEAYERFNAFEEQLLSVKEVKWKKDDEMHARIHLSVLEEEFGSDRVKEVLDQEGVDIIYLSNHEAFSKIANLLKQ